jgi:N-acetylmuramoyl-L-alanine amidase
LPFHQPGLKFMPQDHLVRQGECLVAIADQYGHFWETLWNHPKNSTLKQLRKDPNILMPGDQIHIPDKESRTEQGATEQRHRFQARGTPAKLRLRLTGSPEPSDERAEQVAPGQGEYVEPDPEDDEPEALSGTPYALYVDGEMLAEGETDGDGRLEEVIPPGSGSGTLVLDPGTEKERILALNLGRMDPVEELTGVCKRLRNLGIDCPTEQQTMTPEIQQALQKFQRLESLEVTGEADDQTRERLKELHGG